MGTLGSPKGFPKFQGKPNMGIRRKVSTGKFLPGGIRTLG